MSEETLFHEALARPPGERAAFLDAACSGRPELRAAVDALLAAHEAAARFLDRPLDVVGLMVESPPDLVGREAAGTPAPEPNAPAARAATTANYPGPLGPDALIAGRYTLQEKIGEGGMGEVWVARQSEPVKRKVALKLIKPGMDSRAVLQRFEQERQALALMDHPNIARVFDAGLTPTGQPFFAMELVNGLPLTRFCDEARLTPKERLELFVPICQAVQHAHQKGVVHRDLKPANILVTIVDGKPIPKVIDFGVAKATAGRLTDESLSTQFGAVVGTLEYMSPEQAGFAGEDIDTRADIYSLGVILYELLTGLRPLDARRLGRAALTEMVRIIREEEPSRPSTRLSTDESLPSLAALRQTEPRRLMALLRGDLDWVVMKCLEKRRDRRYETASGLARDIQRHLAGDLVEARPPSVSYRLGKFARKHRAALAVTVAFALLLVAATAVSVGLALWANRERKRAEDRESMAIEAVKRFRDAVADNDVLKNNASLAPLRKALLKEPLAFFRSLRDRLQADRDTRPESLERLASAATDLARLTYQIGDKQDAIRAFEEARAINERLARENPTVTRLACELAVSHIGIGSYQREAGQADRALESLGKGLAILEPLVRENPTVTEFAWPRARGYFYIGVVQSELGHPDRALESLDRARENLERLARENPADTRFTRFLADTHSNIGNIQSWSGHEDRAPESLGKALAINERLVRENPTSTEFVCALARSYSALGVVQLRTGRPDQALEPYGKAVSLLEPLAREQPAVTEFARLLAWGYDGIGSIQSEAGQADRALESHGKALAIHERLARENPTVTDFANSIGGTLNNIALIEMRAARYEAAHRRLVEAIAWQKKALAASPSHPIYRQVLRAHYSLMILTAQGLGDARLTAEARRERADLDATDPKLRALDARLAAVLKGEPAKDNAERLTLAERAYFTGLFASAARLWSEALKADPKLGDDRQAQHRYGAAGAAALASGARGQDEPPPDDAARTELRTQARDWLKAELAAWDHVSRTAGPQAGRRVAATLNSWKVNLDLAGIRDAKELAKLPEDERTAWRALWAEVDALLKRVETPAP